MEGMDIEGDSDDEVEEDGRKRNGEVRDADDEEEEEEEDEEEDDDEERRSRKERE